jgi:CubicO group peptidase (beta-lactamase class C family)
VLDLADWLMLQLAGGTWDGQPVIDADALTQTHLPWALSGMPSTSSARSGFYGLGTNVSYDYAGRLRLSHSGGFNQGAATAFTMLPSADLGAVALTNGMPIGVHESVINYFLDHVQAGSAQQDWLTLYGQVFARQYVNHSVLAGQKPPANPIPPRPETFYTGTYDNSYYRPIRITAEGGSLHLLIGPAPDDYPLQHWSGDLFAFFPTGENGVGITAATFNGGPDSTRAQSVTLEFYDTTGLGTFVRP